MRLKDLKYFFLALLTGGFSSVAEAQAGLCPPNLDFEQGNFTNWICRTGSIMIFGGINTIVWDPGTNPVLDRHTIIPPNSGNDMYGGFPQNCPNGSNYSVRLGNYISGAQADGISYTYDIPANATVFSILFHYAVVLQNPNHTLAQQPRFKARIIDLSTNIPIPCVTFDFTASSSLPGFLPSPLDPGAIYKDWTPVSINLSGYAGKTIMLEFITEDCALGAHFGYAYIDVSAFCNGVISGNTICPGDTALTITAPFGFQSYTWYSDLTFSTIISTTQTLYLNPVPTVGSIFPVIVNPYTGFGCNDTLYATITVGTSPAANAGPDMNICPDQQQVQIGAPPNPIYAYQWTPVAQVSNPTASNPFAWTITPNPEEFIVKTTDVLTACIAYDTTYVTSRQVDTAILLNGSNNYCPGDPAAGILSVSNMLSAVQWYNGIAAIPGATGFSYQPIVSGNYWAQVQQFGCTDFTAAITIIVKPLPLSIAGPDVSICINQSIQIGGPPNPAYTYSWTPANQVSNPSISNPLAWKITTNPEMFYVKTTDIFTGCISYDTTYISKKQIDTSIVLNGRNDFCIGDLIGGTLSVSNTSSAVQWHDNTGPIPGATAVTYKPLSSGDYWAEVTQLGCKDSTASIAFTVHPLPLASFTASSDSGCVTNNSFLFTNTSTSPDNASMTYLWKFSDGSTQTVTDATKTFLNAGNNMTELVTTTSNGCQDSTTHTVHVLPNGIANFTWDSICINRPIQFTNLSNEHGSVQVNYNWAFNNGGPGSSLKTPLPVVYTTAGQKDVTLKLTVLGCENYPDSVIKKVQVNVPKPGITYRTITVPQGSSQFIHARDTVGNFFNWRPQTQLSNYHTQYTEFRAVDDVKYLINITNRNTCVTTDTMQILVLKKPGFYLPTAFTPNGDGLNDEVQPYLIGMKGLKSFSVFNRWGNLVFYTSTYNKTWNGKFQGVDQNPGVYVWILEFYNFDNKKVTERGTITLIR